jgi:predicted kinase
MEAVILAGIQGSGKTTFALERFFQTHVRLSLDQLKTRHKENILLHACLAAQQPFVIDNTNVTIEARAHYLRLAKAAGFRCVLYFFETTTRDAIGRNSGRPPNQRVPNLAILGSYKKQQPPTKEEGFDEIYKVRVTEGRFELAELT